MRVPDEILKCVVFIGVDEGVSVTYGGTAFAISIPSERIPGANFTYLVTAGHIADKLEGRNFWVRANLKDGTYREIPGDEDVHWYRHPDGKSVDIALLPYGVDEELDVMLIWKNMMLWNPEQWQTLNIGVGDDVFVTGLFTKMYGKERNLPIVRTGNMAMVPNDKVPTELGLMDAYLIEARSLGGVSGSPVFVRRTLSVSYTDEVTHLRVNQHGSGPIFLLGVMHGHWDIKPTEQNSSLISHVENRGVNLGIAIVTPAHKILEILQLPELVALRTQAEDAELAKTGTAAMDDALPPKKQKPGPEAERLQISGEWADAVKRALHLPPKE